METKLLGAICLYCVFGTGMTLINKACIDRFPMPNTIIVTQNIFTCVVVQASSSLPVCSARMGRVAPFEKELVKHWIALATLFATVLSSSMHALQYVSIPTLIVIRNCITLTTAAADVYYLGARTTTVEILVLVNMLLGAWIYAVNDLTYSQVGYFWLVVNIVTATTYQVCIKRVINRFKLNSLSISFYNNAFSSAVLVVTAIANNEFGRLSASSIDAGTLSVLSLSLPFGFVLSLSSSFLNRALSATSVMVVNNVNKFIVIVLSECLVQRALTFESALGCCTALCFGMLYSHLRTVKSGTDELLSGDSQSKKRPLSCSNQMHDRHVLHLVGACTMLLFWKLAFTGLGATILFASSPRLSLAVPVYTCRSAITKDLVFEEVLLKNSEGARKVKVAKLPSGDSILSDGRILTMGIEGEELANLKLLPPPHERTIYEMSAMQLCDLDFQTIAKPVPTSPRLIGILVTKDDGVILCEYALRVLGEFDLVLVVDGSVESTLAEKVLTQLSNVHYLHERTMNLTRMTDGEMRGEALRIIRNRYGMRGQWVHLLHTDEFPVQSVHDIVDRAERDKANLIRWQALHILPHPSEKDKVMRCPGSHIHKLFRHYHYRDRNTGGFREYRTFKLETNEMNYRGDWAELVPTEGVQYRTWHAEPGPAHLHYKVWNLTAYTPDGKPTRAWVNVDPAAYKSKGVPPGRRGTGIRTTLTHFDDFFFAKWPHCCKYKTVGVFNGNIDSALRMLNGTVPRGQTRQGEDRDSKGTRKAGADHWTFSNERLLYTRKARRHTRDLPPARRGALRRFQTGHEPQRNDG